MLGGRTRRNAGAPRARGCRKQRQDPGLQRTAVRRPHGAWWAGPRGPLGLELCAGARGAGTARAAELLRAPWEWLGHCPCGSGLGHRDLGQ